MARAVVTALAIALACGLMPPAATASGLSSSGLVGHGAATAWTDKTANAVSASGAQLSLEGPLTNLMLCTPYTYKVSIVSPKSYRVAVVRLFGPWASIPHLPRRIHLVAHRKWTGSFSVTFTMLSDPSRWKLTIGVIVQPPHHGYMPLGRRGEAYPFTFAPGQSASEPNGLCAPLPYFGS